MSEALGGLRVLELSSITGQYCGKLFADLGADVTLIEPPEGSPVRKRPPFVDGTDGQRHSLSFAYFNAGKRSAVLDLDTTDGQTAFRRLIASCDLLVESEPPGWMATRGLSYENLREINPSLVMTSITPFGQTGPYAHFVNDDLVSLAMGGMLFLGGYHDSAPIAAAGDQALLAAAQFAAVASMTALLSTGEYGASIGRHIDVSVQECVAMGLENAIQFYELENVVRRREGGQARWAGTGLFDCKDGQIYLMAGGIVPARFREACVRWMIEDGVSEAVVMLEPAWANPDFQMTDDARRHFEACFAPFALRYTRDELYREGQARRIPVCPINTPADLLASKQLLARGHFVDLTDPQIGRTVRVPGAPYALSATPWSQRGPASRLGEHTEVVLARRVAEEFA